MLSLVLLSLVMALVTALAGWVPLIYRDRLNVSLLSNFALGIILGSSFLIILPEGLEQLDSGKYALAGWVCALAGFLFMQAIDGYFANREPHIQENNPLSPDVPIEVSPLDPRTWTSGISLTTLGMTIHAAADGIALGSTAMSSHTRLKFLVFLSIIIHKAPAALSLSSVLMTQKNSPSQMLIKRDIILFSAAGPVLAILLGGFLTLLHSSSEMNFFSGLCLCFSAGTFQYVGVHILQRSKDEQSSDHWRKLLVILAGTVLPLVAALIPE
nr:ZIP9 [Starmerella bombicola]